MYLDSEALFNPNSLQVKQPKYNLAKDVETFNVELKNIKDKINNELLKLEAEKDVLKIVDQEP